MAHDGGGESDDDVGDNVGQDGIKGADINLTFPSVGATENIMLAACRADGKTVIENAAREPEVKDLADFLCALGGKVYGAGTKTVRVQIRQTAFIPFDFLKTNE